jgi:hypothetical protein
MDLPKYFGSVDEMFNLSRMGNAGLNESSLPLHCGNRLALASKGIGHPPSESRK